MAIKFVPGKGWVLEGAYGDGRDMNVNAGSSDVAYEEDRKSKAQASRRAMYGNYDQYMESDNLSWLKDNIGDSWWWGAGRLNKMATDQDRFWREFAYTSDNQHDTSAEIVNRYMALEKSGMSPAEIQQAIYGSANLSPTTENGGAGGGVTGPGMLSGGAGNNPNNPAGDQKQSSAASMLQNGLNPDHVARGPRAGVWGAGHGAGGYGPAAEQQGMMGPDANNMRQAIVTALEKKLLG